MKIQCTASKDAVTVRFYYLAINIKQALEIAKKTIKDQLGLKVKELESLEVFQVDKEPAAEPPDHPGQMHVPGTEPKEAKKAPRLLPAPKVQEKAKASARR